MVPEILLVNAIAEVSPEQMACRFGVADTTGKGITVIVSFIGVADTH